MFATDDRRVKRALDGLHGADEPVPELFDAVVRRHKPRIYQLCLRVTGDPPLAARLTREVVRRCWALLPDLEQQPTWTAMLRLAWRAAVDAVRQPTDPLLEDGVLVAEAPVAEVLGQISEVERAGVLNRVLHRMEPKDRDLIHLRYAERLPTRNIEGFLDRAGLEDRLADLRRRLARELQVEVIG